MALELAYKAATGSDYSKAYFRVISVDCNWSVKYAKAVIYIHRTLLSRTVGEEPVGHMIYNFSGDIPSGDITEFTNGIESFEKIFGISVFDAVKTNPVKLTYEYLKTLPEFKDAKDV